MEKHGERRITAARYNTDKTKCNRTEITRKQKIGGKRLYVHVKRLTSDISQKTWTLLKKGNLQRETESLRKPTQNNAIRTKQE